MGYITRHGLFLLDTTRGTELQQINGELEGIDHLIRRFMVKGHSEERKQEVLTIVVEALSHMEEKPWEEEMEKLEEDIERKKQKLKDVIIG